MKQFAVAFVVSLMSIVYLTYAPLTDAADLNTIKSKVEQRVEERQQQVENGQGVGEVGVNQDNSSSQNADQVHTAKGPEVRTTHWSLLGGMFTLHSINDQLYLSVF